MLATLTAMATWSVRGHVATLTAGRELQFSVILDKFSLRIIRQQHAMLIHTVSSMAFVTAFDDATMTSLMPSPRTSNRTPRTCSSLIFSRLIDQPRTWTGGQRTKPSIMCEPDREIIENNSAAINNCSATDTWQQYSDAHRLGSANRVYIGFIKKLMRLYVPCIIAIRQSGLTKTSDEVVSTRLKSLMNVCIMDWYIDGWALVLHYSVWALSIHRGWPSLPPHNSQFITVIELFDALIQFT